jgi:rare lipoprotein A (peptidoglycan hydrolase)
VRGRGVRLCGAAVSVLMTIGFLATQAASGQDAGVSMSMQRSDARVVYGEVVKVRGRVASRHSGRRVALQYAARGRGFRTVARAKSQRGGRYVLEVRPVRSGKLRVVAGEASTAASASRARRVAVAGRIASKRRVHVKSGRRAVLRGRLRPGAAGRTVRIQVRKGASWRTVDRARTRRQGRFASSWRVTRGAGTYRTRVLFAGDRINARRVKQSRMLVYRPGQASYYGPGLYGNRTACGQTLTPGTLGVANRWLPCGTRVTFRYHGRTVTVPVIDRGPFHGSRIWDLTYATKRKLGFGSTGVVWATR